MKTFLIKNWKTSMAGLYLASITFAKAKNYIDNDTYVFLFGIGVSIGLFASKDGDKSGI